MEKSNQSTHLTLAITDDMRDALRRQIALRSATQSNLIRAIIGEWLEAQGETGDWVIASGGWRPRKPKPPTDNPA